MSCKRRYPSQTTLLPYGHLICTPVAMLVSDGYVRGKLGPHASAVDILNEHVVPRLMQGAHDIYAKHFAVRHGGMLMIDDLLPLMPGSESVTRIHLAGLLGDHTYDKALTTKTDDEQLHISSLTTALNAFKCMRHGKRAALVVTCDDHTTCFLSDGRGSLHHFDSLHAHLMDVGDLAPQSLIGLVGRSAKDEYSGLVIIHEPPTSHRRPI